MKLNAAEFVFFLASLLYDLASTTLTLSQYSEVKQIDQFLSVLCRDEVTGVRASWKGPKNRKLGEKTTPTARRTNFGVQLIFNQLKKKDEGTYTCQTQSEAVEFSLIVEDKTETSTDNPKDDKFFIETNTKPHKKNTYFTDTPTRYNHHYTSNAPATRPDKPRWPRFTRDYYIKKEIAYGYIGEIVNLTCQVEAEPPAKFQWHGKNNKKLIGEENTEENPNQSVLMLMVTSKSFGEYMCTAQNEHGQIKIIFNLQQGSQPNPPTYLRVLNATSDTVTLEIDGPEPTEEEIKTKLDPVGYRVEYRAVDQNMSWTGESFSISEAKTYTLTQLAHTTQYEVRAASRNPAGLSDYTNITTFDTNLSHIPNINITFAAN